MQRVTERRYTLAKARIGQGHSWFRNSVPGSSITSEVEKTPSEALQRCPDTESREALGLPNSVMAAAASSRGECYPYLSKAAHHLLHQGSHGSDVDDLEVIHVDSAVHVNVLPDLPKHAH